jgi:riboflavin synthase
LPPELSEAVTLGASIAVNGCCFTVTSMVPKGQGLDVTFDAIAETQALTNLRDIEVGTQVNVERSAKQDVEIGGHVLSGHIIDTATVADIEFTENNCRMLFKADAAWLKYVFDKGYLAINGASLTVAAVDRNAGTFAINLIPETLKRTNFSTLQVGDAVNIEVESQSQVIVDTVERIMAERYAAETTAQS